jgi:hypothetical protein
VNNVGSVAYDHYKMLFPTLRGPDTSIMQIGEIQFFQDNAGTPAQAILTATDPIIAVDDIQAPAGWKACGTPNTDCSSSPGAETPARGIDNQPSTKYLNFGEEKSGIIITNAQGPVDVNFMKLTTANDAVERDPTSYELYGTNNPITSVNNSNSNGTEVWTLISSGPLSLPDTRFTSVVVPINSPANYTSYRLIFPTVKNAGTANSMQIADIQFATNAAQVPEPATMVFVALGLACAALSRRRA